MNEPTTCSTCGVALFSPAACYGPIGGPVMCVLCWLETAEHLREEDTLMREVDEAWKAGQSEMSGRVARRGAGPMLRGSA